MDTYKIDELRNKIEKDLDGLYEIAGVLDSLKRVIEYYKKNGKKVKLVAD